MVIADLPWARKPSYSVSIPKIPNAPSSLAAVTKEEDEAGEKALPTRAALK
jgi:hypothetical protein